MKEEKNVSLVVRDDLCTGCGTCIALCPKNAIELTIDEKKGIYIPEINETTCNNCGICLKVCPGQEVDFMALNQDIFRKQPDNPLIGNYEECYVGHANNEEIRYECSSGGLITALLIYALEEGIIDGALVTRMKKDKPLEPEPFIARTREEIIEAKGSKYCPVPANIALREILDAPEGEKFAVVGLPCHIHGLRKAEIISPNLRKKIILSLGIVCNHAPTFRGTDFLLYSLNLSRENIINMNYRGNGWPGGLNIKTSDGSITQKIVHDYWSGGFGTFFYSNRCTVCCDQTCELADMAFADAWLPEYSDDTKGTSLFFARTLKSNEFIENTVRNGFISSEIVDAIKIIQSQGNMIIPRKKLQARYGILKLIGKSTPLYTTPLIKPSFIDYLKATKLYFMINISRIEKLWCFIALEGRLKVNIMKTVKNNPKILNIYYKYIK